MIISPPFLPQSGLTSIDDTDYDPMMTAVDVTACISPHLCDLNKTIRKYSLDSSSERLAIFLAQTYIETDRWKTFAEYGKGAENPNIPMAQYYGEFYRRGIMQLTWASA